MTVKLSVDRIEGQTAVCYDDFKKYNLPASGLSEGDIVLAEFDAEIKLISLEVLKDETKKKKSELASRTNALFNRKK